MIDITDLKVITACGFSIVFLKINGHKFKSDPINGMIKEDDIRKELGLQ